MTPTNPLIFFILPIFMLALCIAGALLDYLYDRRLK